VCRVAPKHIKGNIREEIMDITEAAGILKEGGVVVFATDTVWGVGAAIESNRGIEKLYRIKNREQDKPTAVLVGSMSQAERYGDFNDAARELVEKYWPGALTVVVSAKKGVNRKILNSNGGVGIRWADNKVVSDLCRGLGGGIVATSANLAGGKPPMNLSEVSGELLTRVDGVVDGVGGGGKSSTVVDVMGENIKILRQGDVWV
jgi:L-threonylcarbamoyladenylate synthase